VQGRAVVERERQDPGEQTRIAVQERAGDPHGSGNARPREQLRVVAAHALAPERDHHEPAADDLDRDVSRRETDRLVAERPGDLGGHDEADQHQREHQHAHRRQVGIDPVGRPGGVVPGPPDREEEHERLDRAAQGEVVEEVLRELRDREDIDEVEEELDTRDRRSLVLCTFPENGPLHRAHHRAPKRLTYGRTPS